MPFLYLSLSPCCLLTAPNEIMILSITIAPHPVQRWLCQSPGLFLWRLLLLE